MEEFVSYISTSESSVLIENIRNIAFVVATVIGLWLLWVRSRALKKQAEIAQNGYNHDRFTGFLELLESSNNNIRISAVESLKLLIQEDTRYFWPVIKVFTIYANHNLPLKSEQNETKEKSDIEEKKREKIDRTVVQEMINALGDEQIGWLPYYANHAKGMELPWNIARGLVLFLTGQGEYRRYVDIGLQAQKNKYTIVFRRTDLSRMDMVGLFLSVAEFHLCHLNRLYCIQSNFENSKFVKSKLNGAKFIKCNLVNAVFNGCDMTNVSFLDSDINGAEFIDCDLIDVDLSKAKNNKLAKISNNSKRT